MKHVIDSGGRRVACHVDGAAAGLPLVLLHGFCEDASVWDGFLPFLQDIRLIRVDLPGFGASEPAPANGMTNYAEALRAVLDALAVDTCVLVGHSMGGYAALEFAEKNPQRLAGLGLFHSHPFEDGPERKEARRRGIEMLQSGKKDLYVAQLFPGLFPEAYVRDNPALLEALIENGKRQPVEGIIAALENMIARKDHRDTLRHAGFPVLWILGELDAIVPASQALQAAVSLDVADVHILPGIGHMGMFEAPEKCLGIVRSFWDFCNRT